MGEGQLTRKEKIIFRSVHLLLGLEEDWNDMGFIMQIASFFKKYIYLFIFVCVGSSLLRAGFL